MALDGAARLKFQQLIAEDRRLQILRLLTLAPALAAPGVVIARGLAIYGHQPSVDAWRNDLLWLAEMALISVTDEWAATLTSRGRDVANGIASVAGVARPPPEH